MENEFNNHPALPISKPELSEIETVLEICEGLSPYQLYRLERKISLMLEDPERIDRIKSRLSPGDEIEYFLAEENRNVAGVFLKHNRTYASICRSDDGEKWRIPYCWINVDESEFHVRSADNKLTRDDISVGEFVGFTDRQNQELFGKVIRINQKTVSIDCEDGRSWRVAYSFLFRVLDANSNERGSRPGQQLLIE